MLDIAPARAIVMVILVGVGPVSSIGCTTSRVGPLQRFHDQICESYGNNFECARAVETKLLGKTAGQVRRDSDSLVIATATSEDVVLSDTPDDDEDGVAYSYVGSLREIGHHVIDVSYWEGGTYLLIAAGDGKKTRSDGIPTLSPDGRRLAATSIDLHANYDPTSIEIWRVTPEGLVSEFRFELPNIGWGPGPPMWASDTRLEFVRIDGKSAAHGVGALQFSAGEWKWAE